MSSENCQLDASMEKKKKGEGGNFQPADFFA